MILIDAIYVNNSGGKILLDYLIEEIEKTDKNIFYLLDVRVQGKIPTIKPENKVTFMQASLLNRKAFYDKYSDQFTSILCFGNLPPTKKLNTTVYTYFHQPLFISIPEDIPFRHKLFVYVKTFIFKHLRKNTDFWLVQSENVKSDFVRVGHAPAEKVSVLPFYPSFNLGDGPKTPNSYIYISNAPPHKNHLRLIDAFCDFYDRHKLGTLTLTVVPEIQEVYSYIAEKQKEGYPIINIGFVSREELAKVYSISEFLIYPSLAESFGLGLVEAIECGCKVIGADLPYTYAVCEPSLTFDPLNKSSIVNALSVSLQNELKPSYAKVTNQIQQLVSLLN